MINLLQIKNILFAILALSAFIFLCMAQYYSYKYKVTIEKLNTCNVLIGTQNNAILQMKKEADFMVQQQIELEKKIKADKVVAYKEIDKLKKEKVSDKCEEAVKWGIAHAKN